MDRDRERGFGFIEWLEIERAILPRCGASAVKTWVNESPGSRYSWCKIKEF